MSSWWRETPRNVSWPVSWLLSGESDLYQFRVLPSDQPLPTDARSGVQYETFSVNPEVYLSWLKSELESRGVKFVRRRINSLDEACELAGERGAVINATGLGEVHNNSKG